MERLTEDDSPTIYSQDIVYNSDKSQAIFKFESLSKGQNKMSTWETLGWVIFGFFIILFIIPVIPQKRPNLTLGIVTMIRVRVRVQPTGHGEGLGGYQLTRLRDCSWTSQHTGRVHSRQNGDYAPRSH